MARALIHVPKQANKGDIIDIKVLISHPMKSGQWRDEQGRVIPRKIMNRFCAWDGEEILSAELFLAIAANPCLAFSARAEASGTISRTWVDDDGHAQTELVAVTFT